MAPLHKSLPAEVDPPPLRPGDLRRGLILVRGSTYLRVVVVQGKRLVAQVREGASGRFTRDPRHFDLGRVLRLYRVA